MKKNKFPSITKKIILYIAFSDFILCSLVFAVSYWSFNRQFRAQYDSSLQEMCSTAREMLNPDDFATYYVTRQPDEAYHTVFNNLQYFVDEFDLNLI